ncbi:MAG: DUF6261 family protein [Tannerellaceae bacterium]|jgi:hypothetical protein|nr:DUF6261 family protein [Tannerellaceae bacterium]
MSVLIPLNFKTMLRKLHIAEHFDFFENGIIKGLSTLIAGLTALGGVFAALQVAFAREDAFYKKSLSSALTGDLANAHQARVSLFTFFWANVSVFKYLGDESKIEAADKLQQLHKTYKSLPTSAYQDTSGMMTNFLQDCKSSEWLPYIQSLGITYLIDKMEDANVEFKAMYIDRSVDKEHVADIGNAQEVRAAVDNSFDTLVEAVNAVWVSNEIGAKDPTMRANLIAVRDIIEAAIHQAQTNLARRKRHKTPDSDKTDEGTQTPDTTPPAPPPPPSGTQNPENTLPNGPDTTQNPDGDRPHVLDPDEHPPAGE